MGADPYCKRNRDISYEDDDGTRHPKKPKRKFDTTINEDNEDTNPKRKKPSQDQDVSDSSDRADDEKSDEADSDNDNSVIEHNIAESPPNNGLMLQRKTILHRRQNRRIKLAFLVIYLI